MVLLCHPLYRIKCIIKKVRLNLLMKNLKLCFSFIFLFFVYNAKKFINFFYHCIKRISQLPYFTFIMIYKTNRHISGLRFFHKF